MYTNELLEEKYQAQRELSKRAKNVFPKGAIQTGDYFNIVKEDVNNLFKKMGWTLRFSKRKGEWHPPVKNA